MLRDSGSAYSLDYTTTITLDTIKLANYCLIESTDTAPAL